MAAPDAGDAGAFAQALAAFRAGASETTTGEAGIVIAVSGEAGEAVPELPVRAQIETVIGLEAVLVPAVGSDIVDPTVPSVETPPVPGATPILALVPGETPPDAAELPETPDADLIVAASVAPAVPFAPVVVQTTADDIALKIAAAARTPENVPQLAQNPLAPAMPDTDGAAPATAPLLEGRASAAGAPPPVLSTGETVPAMPKEVLENFAPRAPVTAPSDDVAAATKPVAPQPTSAVQSAPIPAALQAIVSDPGVVSMQAKAGAVISNDANEDDAAPASQAIAAAPRGGERPAVVTTPSVPAPTTPGELTVSEPVLAAGSDIKGKAADAALAVLTEKQDTTPAAKPASAPELDPAAPKPVAAPASETNKPVPLSSLDPEAITPSDKPVPEKPVPDRPAATDKPAQPNDVRAPQPPVPVNDKPAMSELAARGVQQQAQSLPAAAIPQIASEFAAKIKRGATRFEIRLDPPELGRIDVRIDVDKDGRVTSRLMVEKTETLDLLKADQRALERALHDAGFKSDQNTLSFSLKDERGSQAKFDEQRQLNQQSETAATEEDPVRQVAENAYRASLRGPGGFDLRV